MKPVIEHVLIAEVLLSCGNDAGRLYQAIPLPIQASLDHPLQDAGSLSQQLLLQLSVRLSRLVFEGHNEKAPARSFVHVTQNGLVVPDNDQFELWRELKEILPHKPRANPVSAGQ